MRMVLVLLLMSAGCSKKAPPKVELKQENSNPFKDVTPKKVGDQVETIQKEEEERNDKRIEQMKE